MAAYQEDQVRNDGWTSFSARVPIEQGYYLIRDFTCDSARAVWAAKEAIDYRISHFAGAPEVALWDSRDRQFYLLYMPFKDDRFGAARRRIVATPRYWREIADAHALRAEHEEQEKFAAPQMEE